MERVANEIWIVSRDAAIAESVRGMFDGDGAPIVRDFAGLSELAEFKADLPAMAALIDIDANPSFMLELVEPVIARYNATRFVAVASGTDHGLLLAAMNAGARHFVSKASLAHELPPILERLHTRAASSQRRGTVLTVLSAGGGCGATTLAVNLARDLPAEADHPSLLIDMDDAYGAIAEYLGLHGEYGLAQVLAHTQRIDPQLVATTAVKYDDRLHVLINPVSVNFEAPDPLRFERLEEAIHASRQAYRWVVVDAPRVSIDVAVQLAQLSRTTLIVSQLTVKDVRAARKLQQALVNRGVSPGSIRHVINRYRSRHSMISLAEAQRALGEGELWLIKNDFGATVESINLGRPLAECAPRSVSRRDIRQLAEGLASLNGSDRLDAAATNGRRDGLMIHG